MQSKGISLWIYELPGKIRENKQPVYILYTQLFQEFNEDIQYINEEKIKRVADWLDENNLETEPKIELAPANANLRIQEKKPESYEFEKLPLNSLPCAHIGREKLPIILNNNFKLNLVADQIVQKKEEAYLILEDNNQNPIGIIDTYSFAKFINLKNESCDINQIIRPIFICAKSSESLMKIVDEMIENNKPYLIITDENNSVTGFSSLNGLLKEYYPFTKPFLILSKIENLFNDSLKLLGCTEVDYKNIVREDQRERFFKKLRGRQPTVYDLTIGQKFDILRKKKTYINLKFGKNYSNYIDEIEKKWDEFHAIRNKYCHFNNTLHINNTDLLFLQEFCSLIEKFGLILITKTNTNYEPNT